MTYYYIFAIYLAVGLNNTLRGDLEMNVRRILFGLFSSMVCYQTDAKIVDCSNGASLLKITELGLSPDPPVRGKQIDMIVKFDNPGSEITEGSVTTSISLNYIPFQPSTEALCSSTICPLVSGPNDRSTNSVWPDSVSGIVSSKIEWKGLDGSELLCIQINSKIAAAQKKGLRPVYNQTHAELIAKALSLKSPVCLDELDTLPWERVSPSSSKQLVVWTSFLNALNFSNASKLPESN
jgi:hypothetical protein